MWSELIARIRGLFGREGFEREMDLEMRFHLEARVAELEREGLEREEAMWRARREFGPARRSKEEAREAWGFGWLSDLARDLRFGARLLRKNPGFTAIAVLTLALGIGANAAIFSVIDAVLLRPLPYADSAALVTLTPILPTNPAGHYTASYPDFMDWRAQSSSFSSMTAFEDGDATLTGSGEATKLNAETASANLFETLGVYPEMGGGFVSGDDAPGARSGADAAVISHAIWQERFGGDSNVLGRQIVLDGKPFVIVGVMPAGFQFPIEEEPIDVWTTIALMARVRAAGVPPPTEQRNWHGWSVIARLRPGISPLLAQAEMSRIEEGIAALSASKKAPTATRVLGVQEWMAGDSQAALLILFAAVGCVLLIACANVANLLLARGSVRARETALRSALGAGRGRIVRQLLTETLLLYFCGAALGLLLSRWAIAVLVKLGPMDIPRLADAHVSARVLWVSAAVAFATAILFGLVPALQTTKVGVAEGLQERGSGADSGLARGRFRNVLIVAEVALAFVLLTSAGLLVRTFRGLERVNPGFNAEHVLTFSVAAFGPHYPDDRSAEFYSRFVERLGELPGVLGASAIGFRPFGGGMNTNFAIRGRPAADAVQQGCDIYGIEPNYFDVMQIPLIAGRTFTVRDGADAQPVVIISQSFARRYFSGQDPIGQQIQPMASTSAGTPMRTIVGVVADVKADSLREGDAVQAYMPYPQFATGVMAIVMRTAEEPDSVVNAAREELRSIDPDLPLERPTTIAAEVSDSIAAPRYNALLLAIFAGLALALSVIGLYGVISFSVSQRTREIGVRMALGAQARDVLGMVVGRGAGLVAAGLVIGAVGSLAATRVLEGMLFGIKPTDVGTYFGTAVLLAVTALAACWVPARRAMRVDPVEALRSE